ncbi:hypothetical protein yc1106_06801 [Curvularia clavata]|uniref:Uncharacterized protein n=1 Tax=Curvularia clavata TaxID=95742 RepID=A0A9Q8ZAG4_CURCL|nr:hypothetical protein yc1106_06801 [Curvularia clavata]
MTTNRLPTPTRSILSTRVRSLPGVSVLPCDTFQDAVPKTSKTQSSSTHPRPVAVTALASSPWALVAAAANLAPARWALPPLPSSGFHPHPRHAAAGSLDTTYIPCRPRPPWLLRPNHHYTRCTRPSSPHPYTLRSHNNYTPPATHCPSHPESDPIATIPYLGTNVTTASPRSILKKPPTSSPKMPSARTNMPTAVHTKPAVAKKERVVGFYEDPVISFCRPVNTSESWAAYHFEMHARKCAHCHNPYEVHRNHDQLCDVGHALAQDVARYIYQKSDGATYSTMEENNKLVRVEIPAGYVEVCSLLKAIERSLRHRSRKPFVSMDRSYYVAPRSPPSSPRRSHTVKVEQEPKSKTKSSREIVDWPQHTTKAKRPLAEISNTPNSKRGSLYEEDLAKQRRNAKHYAVEVREPSSRDLRDRIASDYYR